MKTLRITLEEDLLDAIDRMADSLKVPRANIVRDALVMAVRKNNDAGQE